MRESFHSREDGPRRGRPGRGRALHLLQELGQDLLALLWPTQCVACGAPDRELCADCRAELRRAEGRVQLVDTAAGRACVAGPYAGPLRALLLGYKHAGLTRFASVLGAQLRAPLREALNTDAVRAGRDSAGAPACAALGAEAAPRSASRPAPLLIVTVPSRPVRVRERGYRHVDLLVRAALRANRRSGETVPHACLVPGALRTLRGRTSQVGLHSAERERNAALVTVPRRMRGRLRGRTVVLVDDVVTTGATVAAVARALGFAGVRVAAVVALCATERRDSSGADPRPELRDARRAREAER